MLNLITSYNAEEFRNNINQHLHVRFTGKDLEAITKLLLGCLGNPDLLKEFREYFRKHERTMLREEIELASLRMVATEIEKKELTKRLLEGNEPTKTVNI